MTNPTHPRKVFQGVADRPQMFRLFNRHAKRPTRFQDDAASLHAGEWFEISEAEHDYMFEILPPLWIRGSTFAMREFLTGSVTSVFFALKIDDAIRYFHGYRDLSDTQAVERMRVSIVKRETRPVRVMTRDEHLEHIWSSTADAYRGYADDRWPHEARGQRTIVPYDGSYAGVERLLADLTGDEIAVKLPVHLRYPPAVAAA